MRRALAALAVVLAIGACGHSQPEPVLVSSCDHSHGTVLAGPDETPVCDPNLDQHRPSVSTPKDWTSPADLPLP